MTVEELALKVQQLEMRLALLEAIDKSILESKEEQNEKRNKGKSSGNGFEIINH